MGVWHVGASGLTILCLWSWVLAIVTGVLAAPVNQRLWTVHDIRHWSDPTSTRVVIVVEGEAPYRTGRLHNPDRIYIDLLGTQIAPKLQGVSIEVADKVLKSIRAAQNQADVVRVVLDLKTLDDYRIFTLTEPFRLVIDIAGQSEQDGVTSPVESVKPPARKPPAKTTATAPAAPDVTASASRWHVVLDAGHGGKDPGAIGTSGLMEKDVVLDIVLRLRELMRREPYWRVSLTRESDVFIPLEERTAIANRQNADLFVSIHANAAERPDLHGIETYFLDIATDERAKRTAARENATSLKQVSDLELILRDLLMTSKRNESSLLAGTVQRALVQAPGGGKNGRDLGVKQAPFLVLIGAEMPGILIETGFISHPAEERKLADPKYRAQLARAILAGIKEYIAVVNGSLVRQVSR